ncbi:MAG TPA: hypothetical protein VLT57_18070 [Bryobacteraceae bacterium]|nr:hypothetical protein [Bryobacteraceae bacterium]
MSGAAFEFWLLLPGAAIAAMLGGIATPGKRGLILWGICAAFMVLAVWLWFKPNPAPWIAALIRSNALIPVVTVGIVALMISGRRAPPAAAPEAAPLLRNDRPIFAADDNALSKWTPDISLAQAVGYLGTKTPLKRGNPPVTDVVRQLILALNAGKVTAWAKDHPKGEKEYQVRPAAWGHADVTLRTNYAFFKGHGVSGYDVRLCQEELEHAWPQID